MLEEKLKKIDKYFISLSKKGDYKGLEVSFPAKWEIEEPKDVSDGKLIEIHRSDDGKVVFIGNENVTLIELVDFVNLTAITNRENEAKDLLLNNKIKELRGIFKSKRLSELECLKFTFDEEATDVKSKDNTVNATLKTPKATNVVAKKPTDKKPSEDDVNNKKDKGSK